MARKDNIQEPAKSVAAMSDEELRERFPDFPFSLLEPGEHPLLVGFKLFPPDGNEGSPNRPRRGGETGRQANRRYDRDGARG